MSFFKKNKDDRTKVYLKELIEAESTEQIIKIRLINILKDVFGEIVTLASYLKEQGDENNLSLPVCLRNGRNLIIDALPYVDANPENLAEIETLIENEMATMKPKNYLKHILTNDVDFKQYDKINLAPVTKAAAKPALKERANLAKWDEQLDYAKKELSARLIENANFNISTELSKDCWTANLASIEIFLTSLEESNKTFRQNVELLNKKRNRAQEDARKNEEVLENKIKYFVKENLLLEKELVTVENKLGRLQKLKS